MLERAKAAIENGIATKLHLGAQLYVSCGGETVGDFAFGEAREGVPMRPETLMFWISSVKPITTVAIAQMRERGKLELDNSIARHIPEFSANGKEGVTIRHVLTHTGGCPGAALQWSSEPWEKIIAEMSATPLATDWVPGERMGYHAASGWYVLAEIVRRIDGRPYPRYLREEILEPLEMRDTWLGMPPERHREYAAEERIAPMHFAAGLSKPIPHDFAMTPWRRLPFVGREGARAVQSASLASSTKLRLRGEEESFVRKPSRPSRRGIWLACGTTLSVIRSTADSAS
jgi:CubicO group peptidase (beta-lactamase class C family)